MSEQKAEYITDAMEMMGKGYEHPAVVITPPTTEFALGDQPGFVQTKTPAFVKISTAFKKHMINLKGARLAIWLYVALSVNDNCKAYPSIETIERDTGYSNRAIIDAVKDLEASGYLSVKRREGTSHLYTINGFAAIGKAKVTHELSSQVNFSPEPVNFSTPTHEESSHKLDINQNIKPDSKTPKSKIQMPENAPIDWLIAGGVSSEQIATLNQKEAEVKTATDAFERALNFNPLPWGKNSQWQRFKKFVMGAYQQDPSSFKKFQDKREKEGQFTRLPANPKIYQDPDLLIAIWPGLFPKPTEADQSARILASIAAQYHN
jgi:hypothetical protein